MGSGSRFGVVRRFAGVAALCVLGVGLVTACAETTRYRVLDFLFDGVPDPNAPPPVEAATPATGDPAEEESKQRKPVPKYAHAPYRENRCRECHDRSTGRLIREPEDGLCRICHGELIEKPTYLHGPVAVDACAFCHHHHSALFPKLLLAEATELCFGCHQREDLTEGSHHVSIDEESCTSCHDAHGGEDPFFLSQAER